MLKHYPSLKLASSNNNNDCSFMISNTIANHLRSPHSSFLIPHSSFLLPPSSFLLPPSSFLLPPSSFLLHPSFLLIFLFLLFQYMNQLAHLSYSYNEIYLL